MGLDRQKCFPPCRIFFWTGFNNRDLSKKTLGGPLLRDSVLVELLPFLSETSNWSKSRMGSRRWLIGKYRPISEFCHINIHPSINHIIKHIFSQRSVPTFYRHLAFTTLPSLLAAHHRDRSVNKSSARQRRLHAFHILPLQ